MAMTLLDQLFHLLEQNGGFTIDNRLNPKEKGYAVPVKNQETQIVESNLDLAQFKDLIIRYYEHINEDECLGTWKQAGVVYFDVSRVVESIEHAISLACQTHQIAVYDLENNESIYLQ